MRRDFEQRLRRLEAIMHDRLAEAAATATVAAAKAQKRPVTREEAPKRDYWTLLQKCREFCKPPAERDTAEYRRLYAHYRRMTLQQLMRQYPHLKRRQRKLEAAQTRRNKASSQKWIAKIQREFDECAARGERYLNSEQGRIDNRSSQGRRDAAKMGEPTPAPRVALRPAWQPAWSV